MADIFENQTRRSFCYLRAKNRQNIFIVAKVTMAKSDASRLWLRSLHFGEGMNLNL